MILAGLRMVVGKYSSGRLSIRFTPIIHCRIIQGLMRLTLLLILLIGGSVFPALIFTFIYMYRMHVWSFGSTADTFITNSKCGETLASLAQVGFNLGNAMGA